MMNEKRKRIFCAIYYAVRVVIQYKATKVVIYIKLNKIRISLCISHTKTKINKTD